MSHISHKKRFITVFWNLECHAIVTAWLYFCPWKVLHDLDPWKSKATSIVFQDSVLTVQYI